MRGAPEILDTRLLEERRRRLLRQMANGRVGNEPPPDFLLDHALQDVRDRLSLIKRSFSKALVVGDYGRRVARALVADGVPMVNVIDVAEGFVDDQELGCDRAIEAIGGGTDTLAVADEAYDLAVALLSLQYANDLPGVLRQIEKALKPDGLFIGVLLGGATLMELRRVMLQTEAEMSGGAAPRVLPFVDVRDAGALLQRAGFALPVTDAESVTVSYANALDLMRELKAMGATNVLVDRSRRPMTRGVLLRAAELYGEEFPADDGARRIRATFELITMTGWSPDPSQQKPLKPGSGKVSLADVLKPRSQ